MSIQALPQSTVRALGATQALTDPTSLVKELLDNALDANANSVAISISSNTLDVIQVRDNGHGIAPQDRPLVARRYCTSKICDDGDLKDIGGSSLGFRGEALASAAELSGSLLISTRIEGENVATSLRISQQGEVVGQERASLPVGTTVRITDFIKANPVRRQVALKSVDACLKKIKRLLQKYAFARTNVRLSLTVIKAKNKKDDWVYAPKLNRSVEDAAFKIVGSACASACMWSIIEEEYLRLQAFLPRSDADVSKVSNIGSFLSVDARPVSSARGLLKQITKVFRESLKAADSKFDVVKDPFIFLEISGGSYDANLEPAKDDVLFENADMVLQAVKKLFAAVYKPVDPPPVGAEESAIAPSPYAASSRDNGINTHMEKELPKAQNHGDPANTETTDNVADGWLQIIHGAQRVQAASTPARTRDPKTRSNMYACDDEDLELYDDRPSTGLTEADFTELRQSRNDVRLSNPWVFAKMNTKAPMLEEEVSQCASPARHPHLVPRASRSSSLTNYQQRTGVSGLPTPRPSSPSPPIAERNAPDLSDSRIAKDRRQLRNTDLPMPQVYTPAPSAGLDTLSAETLLRDQYASNPAYPYTMRSSAPEPAAGTRLSDIPNAASRTRRAPMSRVNKPFVPPSRDIIQREQVWFDHVEEMSRPRPRRARQGNTNGLVAQGEFGNVADDVLPLTPPTRNRDIRDFIGTNASNSVSSMIESRNYGRTPNQPSMPEESPLLPEESNHPIEVRRHNRGFVPASELFGTEEGVHDAEKQTERIFKRRRTKERIPLRELSSNMPAECAEAEDEVEYRHATPKRAPSRRRSSKGVNRTKSSRLALERIPPGQGTHDLVFAISTSIEQLHRLGGTIDQDMSLLGYNEPAIYADGDFASAEPPDLQALTANLHKLLVTAGSQDDTADSADLFQEVQAAYAQHAADADSDMLMSSA